jgi:hypothetical protein
MKITIWVNRDDLEKLYKFLDTKYIYRGKIRWYSYDIVVPHLVCVMIDYNDYVRLEDEHSEMNTGTSHG